MTDTDPAPPTSATPARATDGAVPRRRRRSRLLVIGPPVVVVAAVVALGAAVIVRNNHHDGYRTAARSYGSVPAYTLTDQNGRTVHSSAFAGKIQVLSYLFPYCRTYCPIEAHTFAALAADLRSAHLTNQVALVSFNVDPEGAQPAQLRQYLQQYGENPADATWTYLTGPPATLRTVVTGGLHIYYEKVGLAQEQAEIRKEQAQGTYTYLPPGPNALAEQHPIDYDVTHNDYVQIADGNGRIVAMYDDPTSLSEAKLFATIRDMVAAGG